MELNRVVAVVEAGDVGSALGLVDRLELDRYHYLHATRAELLRRLDRTEDARAAASWRNSGAKLLPFATSTPFRTLARP